MLGFGAGICMWLKGERRYPGARLGLAHAGQYVQQSTQNSLSLDQAEPQVMEAAGFRVEGDYVIFPPGKGLVPATALLARLRRVADNRGHSGGAEFFPLPSAVKAAGTGSPFLVSRRCIRHAIDSAFVLAVTRVLP